LLGGQTAVPREHTAAVGDGDTGQPNAEPLLDLLPLGQEHLRQRSPHLAAAYLYQGYLSR
jgi:hypothetical protein